jgi:hypothetical protein
VNRATTDKLTSDIMHLQQRGSPQRDTRVCVREVARFVTSCNRCIQTDTIKYSRALIWQVCTTPPCRQHNTTTDCVGQAVRGGEEGVETTADGLVEYFIYLLKVQGHDYRHVHALSFVRHEPHSLNSCFVRNSSDVVSSH